MAQPNRKRAASSGKEAARRPRRRRGLNGVERASLIAIALALMVLSFGAGWHFGVQSTKYRGSVLLVNEQNRLSENYVPEGLVDLYSNRHSFRLAASDIMLTRETYEAAERMFHAAEEQNINGFIITSGYRSFARQQEVYAQSEPGKAQQPGASEHQTGLAFDVTAETNGGFESTPQYAWLSQHAHEYGFIQRYPANKSDITGISYEPWHYRYVGVEVATRIHDTGMTLEEFVQRNR